MTAAESALSPETLQRLRECATALCVFSLLRGIEALLAPEQQQSASTTTTREVKAALFALMRQVVRYCVQWPPPPQLGCEDIFRATASALAQADEARAAASAADSASGSGIALLLSAEVERCLANLTDFTRHCSGETLITWVTSHNATPQQQQHAAQQESAARRGVGRVGDFSHAVFSLASSAVVPVGQRASDGAAAAAASNGDGAADNVSPANPAAALGNNSQHQRRRADAPPLANAAAASASATTGAVVMGAAASTSLEHHAGVVLPFAMHLRASWERAAQERNAGGEAVVALNLQQAAKISSWAAFVPPSSPTSPAGAAASPSASSDRLPQQQQQQQLKQQQLSSSSPLLSPGNVALSQATQANLWRTLHLLPTTAELERGRNGSSGAAGALETLAPFVARSGGGASASPLIFGNVAERRRVHAHAAVCALARARRALLRGELGVARSSAAIAAAQHAPSCGSPDILLAALTMKMNAEFVTSAARDGCQTVGVILDAVVDAFRAAATTGRGTAGGGGGGPAVLRGPHVSATSYLLMCVQSALEALVFVPQAVEESLLRRLLLVLSSAFSTDGFGDAAGSNAGGGGNGGGGSVGTASGRAKNSVSDASDFVDATLARHVVDNAAVPPPTSSAAGGALSSSSAAAPAATSSSPFAPMMTPNVVRLVLRRLFHYAECLALSAFGASSVIADGAGGQQQSAESFESRAQEALLCISTIAEMRYGDLFFGGASISTALFGSTQQKQRGPSPNNGAAMPSEQKAQSAASAAAPAPADDGNASKPPRQHDRADASTAVLPPAASVATNAFPLSLLAAQLPSGRIRPATATVLILSELAHRGPLSAVRAFDRLSSVLLLDAAAPLSWISLQRAVALACASALQDRGRTRAAAAWLHSCCVADRQRQTNRSGFAPAGSVADDIDASAFGLQFQQQQQRSAVSDVVSASLVGAALWGADAEIHAQACLALSKALCYSLDAPHLVDALCLDPLRQQLSASTSSAVAFAAPAMMGIGAAGAGSAAGSSGGAASASAANDNVDVAIAAERVRATQLFALGRPSLALAALEQAATTCLALGYDRRACEVIADAYVGAAAAGDWASAAAWRLGRGTGNNAVAASTSNAPPALRLRGPWRSFVAQLTLRKLCDVLLAATAMVAAPVSEITGDDGDDCADDDDAELAAAEATALCDDAAAAAPGKFEEAFAAVATAIAHALLPANIDANADASFFHSAAVTHLRSAASTSAAADAQRALCIKDAVPSANVASWLSCLAALFDDSASKAQPHRKAAAPVTNAFVNMLWNALFPATPRTAATAIAPRDIEALEAAYDDLCEELSARREATAAAQDAAEPTVQLDTITQSAMNEQARFVLSMASSRN